MKKLQVRWPWDKVERGQGFFIPCLDPEPLRLEGLNQALNARVFNAGATIGIKDGLIGVLFYRKPVPTRFVHKPSVEQPNHFSFDGLPPELSDPSPPASESLAFPW